MLESLPLQLLVLTRDDRIVYANPAVDVSSRTSSQTPSNTATRRGRSPSRSDSAAHAHAYPSTTGASRFPPTNTTSCFSHIVARPPRSPVAARAGGSARRWCAASSERTAAASPSRAPRSAARHSPSCSRSTRAKRSPFAATTARMRSDEQPVQAARGGRRHLLRIRRGRRVRYKGRVLIVWVAAAGTVGVIAAAAARYLRSEARFEAAAKLPITPMRQVADGALVKVAGTVDPESARLSGPITGRACVAWSVEVQAWDGYKEFWYEVVTEWRSEDFVLVGDGGVRARVVVDGAEVIYGYDRQASATWRTLPPERVQEFLRHRLSFVDRGRLKYRVREAALEPGERVVVIGKARRELDGASPADGGAYREAAQRLVFAAAAAPLWIMDGAGPPRAW